MTNVTYLKQGVYSLHILTYYGKVWLGLILWYIDDLV